MACLADILSLLDPQRRLRGVAVRTPHTLRLRSAELTATLEAYRELVQTLGARPTSVIIGHAQNLLRPCHDPQGGTAADRRTDVESLLRTGGLLCFDSFGCEWMLAGA